MSDSEKKIDSRIGLDVGTSRIVLARRVDDQIECRSQANAFVRIPFSPMIAKTFKKEGIPHRAEKDEIIIYGDEAERFANIFHVETRRPMYRGALNPSEPESAEVIQEIITILAGAGPHNNVKLCAGMPGPLLDSSESLKYHETVVRQTTSKFGFEVTTINEGLAVVYSELAESNYTGIGVSCGGGMCNVCLSYLSVPVVCFSVPAAGDFIDASAASATGEVATRIRLFKERSFFLNGASNDKIHNALMVYYGEMIRTLVEAMVRAFSDIKALPEMGRPVPVVLSGGSTIPRGFRDRFEKALRDSEFPIPITGVAQAAEPLHSTAKGALIALLAD